MSMKSSYKMLGLLAAASMMGDGFGVQLRKNKFDEKEVDGKLKGAPVPKGMKRFEIDGQVVYAINEKNAKRKSKKATE